MQRRTLGVIALIGAILIGLGGWWLASANQPQSPTGPSIANSATIFQDILPKLKQSQVPPQLPTYIPVRGQRQSVSSQESLTVYANLSQIQSSRYEVILGHTPDCRGGNACRLGTVIGEVKPTKSAEELYKASDYLSKGRRSQEPLAAVTLSKGLQGVFLPWRCTTSCSDAQVVWEDGSYRYSVGIKVGDKVSLVRMANSAIEKGR